MLQIANLSTSDTFFRYTGRDLAVISAAVQKKTTNSLRVLDAMCGCGIRSLCYRAEADADFVQANDANPNYSELIAGNLEKTGVGKEGWAVKYLVAKRLPIFCFRMNDSYQYFMPSLVILLLHWRILTAGIDVR